jgi:hypothetical protein
MLLLRLPPLLPLSRHHRCRCCLYQQHCIDAAIILRVVGHLQAHTPGQQKATNADVSPDMNTDVCTGTSPASPCSNNSNQYEHQHTYNHHVTTKELTLL